jgi:hypothetical protein
VTFLDPAWPWSSSMPTANLGDGAALETTSGAHRPEEFQFAVKPELLAGHGAERLAVLPAFHRLAFRFLGRELRGMTRLGSSRTISPRSTRTTSLNL